MQHPAFIAALEADRSELNQRFKLCSSQGAPLDAQAFQEHLITRVQPVVAAVAESLPERARPVTKELFQVSLELFRAGYWTSASRLPELNRLWQEVLPKLAPLVAREPERVSGALSNALINLATHPVRLDQWLTELGSLGQACESVSQLLDVSGVLAWRSGMTLLRKNSLLSLKSLPPTLASHALGLPHQQSSAKWAETIARLQLDRWFDPASPRNSDASTFREMNRVGEYRGLGGTMMDLPVVFLHQGQLHVTDQANTWRIEVDCFGCILQATGEPIELKAPLEPKDSESTQSSTLDYLAQPSSQAFDGQTLAVTLYTSFHVYLLAQV